MPSAFSRLAPFIREYIYEKKWRFLREIQEAAIGEIFDSDRHILIAAGTAAGKTEACFFPVISLFAENPPGSVGALYIGPLKALINDQAARLEPLLSQAKIPLWRWHGDIPNSRKRKLLQNPSGILQITPESLEALLLRNPAMIRPLFHDLSFVIIDEVHACMGSARGSQILCQLARIEDSALCKPRRIGLSATLADYQGAMAWLEMGSALGSNTALIREEKNSRRLSIAVDHFVRTRASQGTYCRALYLETRGRRCIIFTNSRMEAEEVIAELSEISEKCRGRDRFFIHHGSIPAVQRNETERELRESPEPITAAATATLEMGIDIGLLDRVIQIGPPASVSAFVQRLGRSGRLKGKPEVYFSSLEEKRKWEHPVNALPWDLIKTIAVIELYVKEKWIEPPEGNPLPYSLLVHQTLSILCSLGGQRPAALAKKILSLPAFSRISGDDFALLLSALASSALVEKTDEGSLIAGLEAEKLCSRYSFYSVFQGSSEFRVTAGGQEIGRINFIPPVGSGIVLGGRYWKVEWTTGQARRSREHEIMVSPGEAGGRQVWRGGGADLHRQVAAYMRKILSCDTDYPYLSGRSRIRLAQARNLAKQWRVPMEIFIPGENSNSENSQDENFHGETSQGENSQGKKSHGESLQDKNPSFDKKPSLDANGKTTMPDEKTAEGGPPFVLLPWMGSRGLRSLLLILQNKEHRKILGIRSLFRENDFSVNIRSSLPIPKFRAEFSKIIRRYPNTESLYPLIDPRQLPLLGKYDSYLPKDLLVKQYAAAMLDMEELKGAAFPDSPMFII
jgi:ATP-dependent Lhr-like helicase